MIPDHPPVQWSGNETKIQREFSVRLASVGLAQARPNYMYVRPLRFVVHERSMKNAGKYFVLMLLSSGYEMCAHCAIAVWNRNAVAFSI